MSGPGIIPVPTRALAVLSRFVKLCTFGPSSIAYGVDVHAPDFKIANKSVRDISDLTEDTSPDPNADFVLTYDTSAAAPKKAKPRNAGVTVLDKTGAILSITNTVAETSLYSVVVPAGSMGANGAIRLTIIGSYVNSTATGRTLTIRIKFGGVTIYDDVSATIAVNALSRTFSLEFLLANRNSAVAQNGIGKVMVGNVAAATAGIGDLATDQLLSTGIGHIAGSVNTANPQTLEVTAQHSAADIAIQLNRHFACAELI